ncbi:PHD finger protein 14 [Cricetulus griseus]|uniref:PHD finger protein 14 n=1 Tax=Cricetulus griseus TaxID=10029 RepID=G3HQZ9_CRIGR|nr:PHD finger protein 14 [Cricetulus griseus]ERE89277.1 PHD finger protein 14 [Cricetulus griseus]
MRQPGVCEDRGSADSVLTAPHGQPGLQQPASPKPNFFSPSTVFLRTQLEGVLARLDRSSKRRQVKPLAASLLEALDYDSSDDSDFKVGDASDSEGSGNGSEDPSKDSGEGSCSDSEENILEEELNEDIKAKDEQLRNSTEEEIVPSDKQLIKMEKKEEEENGERPRKKKEKEKEKEREKDKEKATASDTAAASAAATTPATSPPAVTSPSGATTTTATEEQVSEPKKWNLRRNRPLLDFVSMEELNDMDDYDSEDDNDWRPTVVKRKGRSASQKEGSDGDNEDDEDEGSGSDEDENDEGNEEDHSSPPSEVGCKKKKGKVLSRNSADDEELTNDSLTLSQSKSNEDSLILEKSQNWSSQKMDHILICCVCLGDNSEDADEIIQCDNCGITVHEGCYGVDGESDSIMSSASENSTEPWFCDACKCGVSPSCELCPNQDGIFKETDAGRWVHIVCALYVPGVAFGDIDKLRPVTLTEMNYSKYGAKARINARLQQYRAKAELARSTRPQAWVPREKLPRPLTSSASAIRKLMRKAELMGISTDIFPVDNSDTSSSVDGRRKHKQPALTADFVNYYFERNMRMIQIQENMAEQKNIKDKLENEQEKLHVEYNKLCESLEELQNLNGKLRSEGQGIWALLGRITGQCSECDQAGSSDMEAEMAMETLPDGTKRSRRQIKEPVKFVPQDVPPEPKKIPIRNTVFILHYCSQ